MVLENFTRERAEQLDALPAQDSPIEAGCYAVKHTEKASAWARDDQIQSTLWFRTPPLTTDTIRRITGVRLFAESRDQGRVSDSAQGNWTWFELGIYKDQAAAEPRWERDLQLVEFYLENNFENTQYTWLNGRPFERRKENLLNLLEDGNTIGVRVCARFPGWAISAKTGYLVLEIAKGVVEAKDVPINQMQRLAYEIRWIDNTIQEVNDRREASFKPAVPEGAYNVGEINRGIGLTPLRVLCLDGGGVRGLVSLHLLKAVLENYDPNPKLRPCDVFDMIGGTSTGGLIAIMLGCFKMTVDECIAEYLATMGKVFKHYSPNSVATGARYSSEPLETEIKRLIRERRKDKDENAKLLDENNSCNVFVLSVDQKAPSTSAPIFLRSYVNKLAKSEVPDIKIWQAARATSAAPTYFTALEVDKRRLVDGGLAANNPLGWLWTEIVGVYGPARRTQCLLSLGTGVPVRVPIPDHWVAHPVNAMSALAGIATNTEIVHVLFRTLIDALAPQAGGSKYWRLNIAKELMKKVNPFVNWGKTEVEIGLDDSDEAARKVMINAANEYISDRDNQEMIEKCARALK